MPPGSEALPASLHHLQWIYFGAYLGALVIGLFVLAWASNKERSHARIGSP